MKHRIVAAALAGALAIAAGTGGTALAAAAAPPSKPSWRDRMFFGGGVGLGFGDVDFVSIEPLFGVHLSKQFSVGGSLLYRWTQDNRYDPDLNTTDYGARAFAQYFVVPQFFLQAEYEYLDYEYQLANLSTDRTSTSSVFAGAGISQPLGEHAAFFVSTLYNFSYDNNDPTIPYDSPWVVRAGVTAGF